MYINEVCKECNLTKKAVEYYEKQGLIQPATLENGYRDYSEQDVARLKEIALLRKLDIGTADIRAILESRNKAAILSKNSYLQELKLQKTTAQQHGIEALIRNYDLNKAAQIIEQEIDPFLSIKERLVQAFPGTLGMYLAIHFGFFLQGTIDGPEKEAAYRKCVAYLDGLEKTEIPEDLKRSIEAAFSLMEKSEMEKVSTGVADSIENIETFMDEKEEFIQAYLEMRTSDEFKQSEAGKFQTLLREMLQKSGYERVFLHNLKILSPDYRAYTEKLSAADAIFLQKYPQAVNLNK